MSDQLINRTIKHYRIDAVLGQGGMGTVYRATDMQLLRAVALKVMHPNFAIQKEFQQRFLQEARASANLDHPNIIRIYEFDLNEQLLYMVTELVSGGSLRDYLKQLYENKKFIEVSEGLALTRQVAYALDYAHAAGLIHRDVKPDNVLLKASTSGSDDVAGFRAILTDFGLAKLSEGGVQSIANNPTGTLPYMSPEQAMAEPLDGRSDIYALGVMLYEISTGRLPFLPRSIPEAIKMHTTVEPERPTVARGSLSPALEAVILKAMAKKPEERYQTAAEFARAITEVERVGGQIKRGKPAASGGGAAPVPANNGGQAAPRQAEVAPEPVASIGTYLASMAPVVMPNIGDLPENNSAVDQIVITAEGEPGRTFSIKQNVIEIGRDPVLPLSLVSPKVSRKHARIERRPDGQYTITDLGSSNGTYLDNVKLLSNSPEVWAGNKTVRVGNFLLTLQRAGVSYQTGVAVQAMPSISPAGAIPPPVVPGGMMGTMAGAGAAQGLPGGIDLKVTPGALTIEAGGRTDVRVEVRNMSELVEHYQFHIDGIPKEWYTLPLTTLQLMTSRDGEGVSRGSVSISFHPPRNCKSTAGPHTITLRVTSQDRGKEVGRTSLIMNINPFYQYKADLQPKKVRNSGNLRIIVKNEGNAPESYTLVPTDREESLHFDPSDQAISAAECLDEVAVFYVRPQRRPFIGFGTKHYQLEIGITASGSPIVQPLNAELVVGPRIPWWLLIFLLLLCLLCLFLVLFLRCQFFAQFCPPPPAQPAIAVTSAHETLEGWLTATANSFQIRQTATFGVRQQTATAVASQVAGQTLDAKSANANATSTQAALIQNTKQANDNATNAAAQANAIKTALAPAPTTKAP